MFVSFWICVPSQKHNYVYCFDNTAVSPNTDALLTDSDYCYKFYLLICVMLIYQ